MCGAHSTRPVLDACVAICFLRGSAGLTTCREPQGSFPGQDLETHQLPLGQGSGGAAGGLGASRVPPALPSLSGPGAGLHPKPPLVHPGLQRRHRGQPAARHRLAPRRHFQPHLHSGLSRSRCPPRRPGPSYPRPSPSTTRGRMGTSQPLTLHAPSVTCCSMASPDPMAGGLLPRLSPWLMTWPTCSCHSKRQGLRLGGGCLCCY